MQVNLFEILFYVDHHQYSKIKSNKKKNFIIGAIMKKDFEMQHLMIQVVRFFHQTIKKDTGAKDCQ